MKGKKTVIASFLFTAMILSLAIIVPTETAEAVPAFARKYSMSCTTCHAPVPRLKDYGDEFAGNGFILKDQDAPRYTMETGDEKLDLIRDLPLAFRFEGYVKHQTETGKEVDFSYPYNLKLLSGGSLTRDIAYYFYFYISEHGEIAGIEDAYIMFNDVFDSELDIYVGQFQVSDPLFKRELRLTYEDYEIYKHKPGESQIDLAYDRGFMFTYGFPSGTDVIAELINGNGIGEADDSRVYDDDQYKCGVFRVSQDINEYLRVGGFGLFGKEGDPHVNEVMVGGFDATIAMEPIELNLQFLERKDSNPELDRHGSPGTKVLSRGGLMELIFLPEGDRSSWYLVGQYNFIDYDMAPAAYQTITAHFGHLIRTNIRAFVEDSYDIENEENRFVLGIMTAF